MSKQAVGLIIAIVVAGNLFTAIFLLRLEGASDGSILGSGDPSDDVSTSIESLRQDFERLESALSSRLAISRNDPGAENNLLVRLSQVVDRLDALEKSLAAEDELRSTGQALELRERQQVQFRAEDGYAYAEDLIAQGKFVVGANGILTFLESHPDHPDSQDLMRRARDGFLKSGYLDKALWMQGEVMEKFPEHRASDLYQIGMLELRVKKFDLAIEHIDESISLAATDAERMKRLLGRAELIHIRDGDEAGLEAFREVERQSKAAGVGPRDVAQRRADRIKARLDL